MEREGCPDLKHPVASLHEEEGAFGWASPGRGYPLRQPSELQAAAGAAGVGVGVGRAAPADPLAPAFPPCAGPGRVRSQRKQVCLE